MGLIPIQVLGIFSLKFQGVSIHWTGPLDWATGLISDPKNHAYKHLFSPPGCVSLYTI